MFHHPIPMGFIQASYVKTVAHFKNMATDFGVSDVSVNYLMLIVLAAFLFKAALFSYCMSKRSQKVVQAVVVEDDEDELKRRQFEIYEQALIRSQL